jgi:hypothetical protein
MVILLMTSEDTKEILIDQATEKPVLKDRMSDSEQVFCFIDSLFYHVS